MLRIFGFFSNFIFFIFYLFIFFNFLVVCLWRLKLFSFCLHFIWFLLFNFSFRYRLNFLLRPVLFLCFVFYFLCSQFWLRLYFVIFFNFWLFFLIRLFLSWFFILFLLKGSRLFFFQNLDMSGNKIRRRDSLFWSFWNSRKNLFFLLCILFNNFILWWFWGSNRLLLSLFMRNLLLRNSWLCLWLIFFALSGSWSYIWLDRQFAIISRFISIRSLFLWRLWSRLSVFLFILFNFWWRLVVLRFAFWFDLGFGNALLCSQCGGSLHFLLFLSLFFTSLFVTHIFLTIKILSQLWVILKPSKI